MPPNKNCFLQVDLTPEVRAVCRDLALRAQAAARDAGHEFEPVEEEGLHMTLVFFGEAFTAVRADKRGAFMAEVAEKVASYGVALHALQADHVEPFPPEKWNLLVATFSGPPALQRFHSDLVKLASASNVCDTERNAGPWRAHVTLGKLRCPSSTVRQVGTGIAQQLSAAIADLPGALPVFGSSVSVHGCDGYTVVI